VRARDAAKILRRQHGTSGGNKNTGDLIAVDYFALGDLLDYYDETKDAQRAVIRARDSLEGVFFNTR